MNAKRKSRALLLAASIGAIALVGCETITEVVGSEFRAELNGQNEVPRRGDPDGWGRADIAINDASDRICTDLEVRNINAPTAAHVHRGGVGVAGPVVVALDPPDTLDSDTCSEITDALADEIRRNPGAFYVNVHTSDYPDGAIRGQLRPEI